MSGLFPHQQAGVEWARGRGPRLYIADEMGLGKSRTALSICLERKHRRIIVFAPGVVLRKKWVDVEAGAMGLAARALEKPRDFDPAFEGLLVAAYEKLTAKTWLETIDRLAVWADAVICDESAHRVSNPKAKRTMAMTRFVSDVAANNEGESTTILMSGTPVVGDRRSVVSQFSVLGEVRLSRQLGRMLEWKEHPYLRVRGRPVPIVTGWTDPKKVQQLIAPLVLRRTEKQIKLPELIESELPIEISKSALRAAVRADLERGDDAVDVPRNEVIDRYISEGKLPDSQVAAVVLQAVVRQSAVLKARPLADYVRQLALAGEPVVVFGVGLEALRTFHRELSRSPDPVASALFTGETPDDERVRLTRRFADGDLRVICATAAVAGQGIDLVRSRRVVFIERGWRPADYVQCLARVRRLSQTASSCLAETAIGVVGGEPLPCERAIIRNASRKKAAAADSGFAGSLR